MVEIIVWVLLVQSNQILLLESATDNGREWALVGGHVEDQESLKQAIIRESYEEIGVVIEANDLDFRYVIDRFLDKKHKIHFFFQAKKWQGEPFNKEPEHHLTAKWYPLERLPTNLGPLATRAINSLKNNHSFTEYGWVVEEQPSP